MIIDFEIKQVELNEHKYTIFTDVEGELLISNNEESVFDSTGILLVELAFFVKKWLLKPEKTFIYKSIDFDDDKLISLIQSDKDANFIYSSDWFPNINFEVKEEQIFICFYEFLKNITIELLENHHIDFSQKLDYFGEVLDADVQSSFTSYVKGDRQNK